MNNRLCVPIRYQPILHWFTTLPSKYVLMGGFAEEALLDGYISEQHSDLDVLDTIEQIPSLLELLNHSEHVLYNALQETRPGRPTVISTKGGSLDIEIWGCIPQKDGAFILELDNLLPHNHFLMSLPWDTFQFRPTTIGDFTIQTISPLALYLLRVTSAMTRNTGEKRKKDIEIGNRLKDAFLLGVSASELSPKLSFLN